jgi:hypothetical protein
MNPEEQKKREEVVNYFRQIAHNEEQQQKTVSLEDFLDKKDKKRVLCVLPQSAGDIFLSTSSLKSIRERYPKPDWTIYYATNPEYFSILQGNPYIDKVIPYGPMLENYYLMVGNSSTNGYFEVVYQLGGFTQKLNNYSNHGNDTLGINLKN